MKNDQKGSVALAVIIVVVLGLVGLGVWRFMNAREDTSYTQNSNSTAPPKNPSPTPAPQQIPPGFVSYERKQAGFTFAYPKAWGEVKIKAFDSPSKGDTYLYGTFTKNTAVTFGGDRQDYSHDGRGVAPTDFPGYIKQGSRYFTYGNFGKTGELVEIENAKSFEELTAANATALYQKGAQFGADFDSITNYDIVRFNLTKSPYFGVNFVLKLDSASSEDRQEFLQAAETFKLL